MIFKKFNNFDLKKILILITINLIFFSTVANSTQQIQEVNYFASLRSNETNVRSGPGSNYPIKFSFKIKNLPVKVISEYDNWCEIEDYEGSRGWVAQNLITKKRHLLTYSKKNIIQMFAKNNIQSRKIYNVENLVIGEFIKCIKDWCAVKINDKKGWIASEDIFGFNENDIET
jgi:SH3-like domain-containing protein